jgi:serine/threonine protein phosphatase 1
VLGDICDGGYNTYEVIEELIKIKDLIFVLGNHDEWFINHIRTGWSKNLWLAQGGRATLDSYHIKDINIPIEHENFFNKAVFYYEQDNMIFVHGGFVPNKSMKEQKQYDLLWDRDLIIYAMSWVISDYDKVFIGHTTTQRFCNNPDIEDCLAPIWLNNLCMMDCGAGWNGKLAIMDIHIEEWWVSDKQQPYIDER